MELTDLFGPGATVTGGKLIIPRPNLVAVGLDATNTAPASVMAAIILLIRGYFEGSLLDFDGEALLDFDGSPLIFQNFRQDTDLSFWPSGKRFSNAADFIYWRWLISFYEQKIP